MTVESIDSPHPSPEGDNQILPDIWSEPIWWQLLERRLKPGRPVVALGRLDEVRLLTDALASLGREVSGREWTWTSSTDLGALPAGIEILVCPVPLGAADWEALAALRDRYGAGVSTLYELLLPYTALTHAQSVLPYQQATIDAIAPFYFGDSPAGPLEELDKIVSLSGKSVIEFGPMEGLQTAALVKAGVKSVACVEARAENMLKMIVGQYVGQWDNVELIMDDFHNVTPSKYGTFDLAFAHGVYYHSNSPFVFLENLVALSSRVFVGGFCATDDLPIGPYESLEHGGKVYRAKPYNENMVESYVRGVNDVGWVFEPEDLLAFFTDRGYETVVIHRGTPTAFAGAYLHFVATKD